MRSGKYFPVEHILVVNKLSNWTFSHSRLTSFYILYYSIFYFKCWFNFLAQSFPVQTKVLNCFTAEYPPKVSYEFIAVRFLRFHRKLCTMIGCLPSCYTSDCPPEELRGSLGNTLRLRNRYEHPCCKTDRCLPQTVGITHYFLKKKVSRIGFIVKGFPSPDNP